MLNNDFEKFVKENVNNLELLINKFKRVPVTKMLKRTGLTKEQFEEFWEIYKNNENIILGMSEINLGMTIPLPMLSSLKSKMNLRALKDICVLGKLISPK